MRRKWWIKIPVIIVIVAAVTLLFGYIVSLLWNRLVPDLFHGPEISYWQAIGLLILSRLLFGRFGPRGGGGGWRRHGRWRKLMQERMANMTPEEREKFREEWRKRCRGGWKPEAPGPGQSGEAKKDTM